MFRALMRVFDYSGRSSRWEYLSFLIGFAFVLLIMGGWVANYQSTHLGSDPQLGENDAAVVALAFLALIAAPHLALKVRRYHDFGWSGWAVLWVLVPLANVFMELMLLFRGPVFDSTVAAAPREAQQITIYNTPGPTGGGAVHGSASHVDQIARLADMHAQGALTPQEFAAAKSRVLRK